MSFFKDKKVSSIHSRKYYSAAITSQGQLYTWGRSHSGCLGHGRNEMITKPTLVPALKGHKVTGLCCSIKDSHTLAITESGITKWLFMKSVANIIKQDKLLVVYKLLLRLNFSKSISSYT